MAELKIGDVVQLKSGGPKMTIANEEQGEFICLWFSGDERMSGKFPRESLIKNPRSQSGRGRASGRGTPPP